jgi:CheY-like chemotaxis protein
LHSPRTVLVVDDNPSVREVVALMLLEQGYTVLVACNGEEGIAIARSQSVDGAVVDFHMPGLDGISTCEELIGIARARQQPFPAWLMTGAYSAMVEARATEAGLVGVLKKPFKFAQLCEGFEECWAKSKA